MNRKIILNTEQINQKITRIAHQIIESNIDEKEVIISFTDNEWVYNCC